MQGQSLQYSLQLQNSGNYLYVQPWKEEWLKHWCINSGVLSSYWRGGERKGFL